MSKLTRAARFIDLGQDFYYAKQVKKLRPEEREYCIQFCTQNDHLDNNDWAFKVNRLFVDDKVKPKNFTLMWELLSVCK